MQQVSLPPGRSGSWGATNRVLLGAWQGSGQVAGHDGVGEVQLITGAEHEAEGAQPACISHHHAYLPSL